MFWAGVFALMVGDCRRLLANSPATAPSNITAKTARLFFLLIFICIFMTFYVFIIKLMKKFVKGDFLENVGGADAAHEACG